MVNIDYLYNPDSVRSSFEKDFFVDKKLGFRVIKHGTIQPYVKISLNGQWTWGSGGIADDKGKLVRNSVMRTYNNEIYTPPRNRF